MMISCRPEAPKEVGCLSVHVTVDREELSLEGGGEKLAESGLTTPETKAFSSHAVVEFQHNRPQYNIHEHLSTRERAMIS